MKVWTYKLIPAVDDQGFIIEIADLNGSIEGYVLAEDLNQALEAIRENHNNDNYGVN